MSLFAGVNEAKWSLWPRVSLSAGVVSEVTRSIYSLHFGRGLVVGLVACTCGFTQHPHLLERCKRRVGLQRRPAAALGQDAKMGERQPSHSTDGAPAGNRQASPPMTPTLTEDRLKHLLALAVPIHLHRQLLPHFQSLLEQQAVKGSSLWPSCSYQCSAAKAHVVSSVLLTPLRRIL